MLGGRSGRNRWQPALPSPEGTGRFAWLKIRRCAVPELPSGVCSFGFQCSDETSQFPALGRVMGETQCGRETTQLPRFPLPPPTTCLLQLEIRVWLHVLTQLPRAFLSKWMKQPLLFPFGDGLLLPMPSRSLFGITSFSSFRMMVYHASGRDSGDAIN